jgi:hypothetical protein
VILWGSITRSGLDGLAGLRVPKASAAWAALRICGWLGPASGCRVGGFWPTWPWDDLRSMGLKLVFLTVSCGIGAGLVAGVTL